MDWDFTKLGIYPMQRRGVFGIFAHPLVHSSFKHLFANTLPFFFLSWCLFYFYRQIAPYILFAIWIGCGLLTFFIGKPGWHIGASGIIYGLAFFLFFSGLLRKYVPLIAISLLVTFLYGGLVWNMFPQFAKTSTSWEGHLSGAIAGTVCAVAFMKTGRNVPIHSKTRIWKTMKKQTMQTTLFHPTTFPVTTICPTRLRPFRNILKTRRNPLHQTQQIQMFRRITRLRNNKNTKRSTIFLQ